MRTGVSGSIGSIIARAISLKSASKHGRLTSPPTLGSIACLQRRFDQNAYCICNYPIRMRELERTVGLYELEFCSPIAPMPFQSPSTLKGAPEMCGNR